MRTRSLKVRLMAGGDVAFAVGIALWQGPLARPDLVAI